MRLHFLLPLVAALALCGIILGQAPAPSSGSANEPSLRAKPVAVAEPVTAAASVQTDPPVENQLAALAQDAANLQKQNGTQDQDVKKQLEILQKQIETQQKMIQLLMKQVKDQPPSTGAPSQKLEVDVATMQARATQMAQRYQELAQNVDLIAEHQDSVDRYGPRFSATLKQLFDPFDNNQTPLSIYGALAFGYGKIMGDTASAANGAGRPNTPGGFYFGEFTPDFLLKLNDWIFLEAEIGIGSDGSVSAGSFAQADFFVNDWLTIIAGRFVAPIGWYNERLNNPWINKLPGDGPGSIPPLFMQVVPPAALLGVQATGSFYLPCTPIKMEYSTYVSNNLNLAPANPTSPTINELANLENMTNTFNVTTNDKAVGGRIGFWWPELGLEAGVSGFYSGDYVAGFEDSIKLWVVDFNYHKGNWDVRLEGGQTYQHAQSFVDDNIRREGFYTQFAYRPRDACNKYLQNTELVYRYTYVHFHGIDPTALDLTTFSTPIDVPVRRQQNEIGINYYFYPRMVLKCAYQINDEPGFHLHDNQFLTELAWGW
jgi:hypothetical protein